MCYRWVAHSPPVDGRRPRGGTLVVPEQIEREVVVAAPVERVWAVLTQAEHVGKWFGDAGAEVDLRPGGAVVIHWKEHGTVRGRIERLEPLRLFSYRWARPVGAEVRDGHSTLVEFTLSPAGDATRLRVVESGFRDLAWPEEEQAEYAADNAQGWAAELDELRAYVQQAAAEAR
jgi:uncharacterized protein YndB with AHSA1/START domain